MQLDFPEPQIHNPFEHLPTGLKQADPTEVPTTLRNQNNDAPKEFHSFKWPPVAVASKKRRVMKK